MIFCQAWLSGSYPIPDSMRDCWGGTVNADRVEGGDSGNGSSDENASQEAGSNAETKKEE